MLFVYQACAGLLIELPALYGGNQHHGVLVALVQNGFLDVSYLSLVRAGADLEQLGELRFAVYRRARGEKTENLLKRAWGK